MEVYYTGLIVTTAIAEQRTQQLVLAVIFYPKLLLRDFFVIAEVFHELILIVVASAVPDNL